eukprot:CAMPEP_0184309302 /NCGR_PEP_ID=MMETSP1049-20130417/17508_1 /TAXON_ID=77928 /ORGANISM="Proteomonas sulcata, Strain CCMP704" /LENGTH=66 /DNA_ID=CAMNT_0026622167 /DNA_START=73 /DNA_END=274 /DNA_ORIENTATION=-
MAPTTPWGVMSSLVGFAAGAGGLVDGVDSHELLDATLQGVSSELGEGLLNAGLLLLGGGLEHESEL